MIFICDSKRNYLKANAKKAFMIKKCLHNNIAATIILRTTYLSTQ